ncbi:hypothetical protein ABH935_009571 [Catenulispora sp. GAS73]
MSPNAVPSPRHDHEWNAAQLNLMLHGAFGRTLDATPVETIACFSHEG